MESIRTAVFCTLLCTAWSATIKAKDDHRTAFFGEDIHIPLPALDTTEVVFRSSVAPLSEVVFYQNGQIRNSRAKLNIHISHLVLEDVGEEDEGTFVVRNSAVPADVRRIILKVRDCALETAVKYGETYHIRINNITGPYILEFRSSASNINETVDPPVLVLINQSTIPIEEYRSRLSVNEKRINLHSVTGADEGSYTVLDRDGKVRKRTCLNVKEHQNFMHLRYDGTLKIKLYINHTKVNMVYTPDSDHKKRIILDQGELAVPLDPMLDGRVSIEGSVFYLKKVKVSDMGVFRVTDLLGFRIADVYVNVEPYKLPQIYVAILSLVGLLAFLLLVCLLSCQIKVRRRAVRARKIALIAEQAGKGDGKAFRQEPQMERLLDKYCDNVRTWSNSMKCCRENCYGLLGKCDSKGFMVVHDAYTRFTEESTLQSTWENNTESTEVEIKGLEVSKAGFYRTASSENNFLEMNDSVAEYNSALPLDSDTDMPQTCASNKLLIDSDSLAAIPPAISEGIHSATRTPDSILSASPATQPRSEAYLDGDLMGAPTPSVTPKAHGLDAILPSISPVPEASQDASLLENGTTLDQSNGADGTAT